MTGKEITLTIMFVLFIFLQTMLSLRKFKFNLDFIDGNPKNTIPTWIYVFMLLFGIIQISIYLKDNWDTQLF